MWPTGRGESLGSDLLPLSPHCDCPAGHLVVGLGFFKDAPLAGASIANRHLDGFGGGCDRTLVGINERLRVALLFAGGAQLVDEEEAISGVLQPSNHLLPLSPEFCEGWSKGHVVDGLPLALCPLPLLDGVIGVYEGPIVSASSLRGTATSL